MSFPSTTSANGGPVAAKSKGRDRFSVQQIFDRAKSQRVPMRICLYGLGGIGKTSFAAQFPSPIFIQSRGETGLETLESAGIASAPIMPFVTQVKSDDGSVSEETLTEAQNFKDVLDAVEFLTYAEHEFRTVVFDVLSGVEKLLHEYTCWKDYQGDWGERGFMSFQKGYETSMVYLKDFTNRLDALRQRRGMTIVTLSHCTIRNFRNPMGADYDRYIPDMHAKSWGWLFGWHDIVLFANRIVEVQTERGNAKKGKAGGDMRRVIYTENGPAFDAKNRHNLPFEISMGDSAEDAFRNFSDAMKASVRNRS